MSDTSDRPRQVLTPAALALRWVFLLLFVAGLVLGLLASNLLIVVIFAVGVVLNVAILIRFRRRT